MYYKIVKGFGPESGEKWKDYLHWRGFLHLKGFDSVDGILRPDLFVPTSAEDWKHCVKEDYKTSLLTDLDYAAKFAAELGKGLIVGVEIELQEGYSPQNGILGYDILDEYCSISCVTNCRFEPETIRPAIVQENGLIGDFDRAIEIRDLLRKELPQDSHSANCHVWAVYQP
jgi:hypothetical protein